MNQKRTRHHEAQRAASRIVEATGIPRGTAVAIADAAVRRRDVPRLAVQRGWPIEFGRIEGPNGILPLTMMGV